MNIEKSIKGFHGVVGIVNCCVYVVVLKKKVGGVIAGVC